MCLLLHGLCLSSLPETVLEAAGHRLKVSAAASAGGDSPLGLGAPLVVTALGGGVVARRAASLLLVERDLATTTACRVGLGLAHAK